LRDSVKDGVTGFLVGDDDVLGLAERIVAVLGDEALRRRLGENALEYAKQFNWDKTAQEFMKVIKSVVNAL
jgi:glycosyltransferase involved in cell wall biosynthesis